MARTPQHVIETKNSFTYRINHQSKACNSDDNFISPTNYHWFSCGARHIVPSWHATVFSCASSSLRCIFYIIKYKMSDNAPTMQSASCLTTCKKKQLMPCSSLIIQPTKTYHSLPVLEVDLSQNCNIQRPHEMIFFNFQILSNQIKQRTFFCYFGF